MMIQTGRASPAKTAALKKKGRNPYEKNAGPLCAGVFERVLDIEFRMSVEWLNMGNVSEEYEH